MHYSKEIKQNKFSRSISLISSALKGEEHDYTKISLRTAIILLAIPMIVEMGMESVFAVVDLFFVGRLGKHAVSTVGLTESVLMIVYSIAMGLSMAVTAVVARRIGEKNPDGAASAAVQSMIIAFGLVVIVSTISAIYAPDILRLMGAEPETIAMGVNYTRYTLASSGIVVYLFLINGIFRGAGNAAIAMKSLILANVLNIILDPIFIYGLGPIPAYGVTGAAIATIIGRSTGILYQLYHLFNGQHIIKLTRNSLKVEWAVQKNIIKIAWPATLQFIIASCSWIFLAKLVAETGGSAASAGYQTAIRIVIFFILPAWGISNAAATLVGQNLGAKNFKRAEDAVWKTAKYNAIFMLSVSVFFFTGADWIVSFFTTQADVKAIATNALKIISTGYVFYGIGMVMINAFNGAGDTKTPTVINIFGFWLFQIPLAYLLATTFNLGPTGVFIAIPVAETSITIAAFILFKKG